MLDLVATTTASRRGAPGPAATAEAFPSELDSGSRQRKRIKTSQSLRSASIGTEALVRFGPAPVSWAAWIRLPLFRAFRPIFAPCLTDDIGSKSNTLRKRRQI